MPSPLPAPSKVGRVVRRTWTAPVIGIASCVALVALVFAPWAEVGGISERGPGVAEHLLAVPGIGGTLLLPVARALSASFYLSVGGCLAVLALITFRPDRNGTLRLLALVGLLCIALFSTTSVVVLAGTGLGPWIATIAAAVAASAAWVRPKAQA